MMAALAYSRKSALYLFLRFNICYITCQEKSGHWVAAFCGNRLCAGPDSTCYMQESGNSVFGNLTATG